MKTYQLNDNDQLVFSANGLNWETIVFEQKDFADIGAAKASEIAAVINRSPVLTADEDERGNLVLATADKGGHTSLEIERDKTTPALGLMSAAPTQGQGLRAAQLISSNAEPFRLASGSEMTVGIDGHQHKIVFDKNFTPNNAAAAEIVKIINAKRKKIAHATTNGRILLRSNIIGAGSLLFVKPAADAPKDAAAALGFVGESAADDPYPAEPARIVCETVVQGIQAVNLTASPIELHVQEGSIVLPARKSIPLSASDAASTQLQNLIARGAVRLSAVKY